MTTRRKILRNTATAGTGTLLAALAPHSHGNTAPATPAQRAQRYRRLGRTGLEISDISFGASQLRTGEEHLVDHALERGINYFDTAESYTRGASETVIGNALKGKRDKAYIVSKYAAGASARHHDIMDELDGSLRRLQTDYVDVYFNHAVNSVDRLANPEWGEFVERAKAQGKLRFTGISGHAGRLLDCVDYALDHDLVDVLLLAYNFGQDPAFYEKITRSFDLIATHQDLPRVLRKAKSIDVGVVAMKTLMGARLNDMRPYETPEGTYAQAAFRWVLANPDVDALVISMKSTRDIDEYLGASGASALARNDLPLLARYAALNGATFCKQLCNACESACPYGVPIPDVLRTRMYATDYQNLSFARAEYQALPASADACLGCSGAPCAGACPNGVDIAALCAPTHRMLA